MNLNPIRIYEELVERKVAELQAPNLRDYHGQNVLRHNMANFEQLRAEYKKNNKESYFKRSKTPAHIFFLRFIGWAVVFCSTYGILRAVVNFFITISFLNAVVSSAINLACMFYFYKMVLSPKPPPKQLTPPSSVRIR